MSADKKPEGEGEAPKKKKGKGKMLIMMLGAVGLGGGGVGGALYGMGLISNGEAEAGGHHVERPELVAREGVSSSAVEHATEAVEHGGRPDPQIFQATYFPIPNNFTSNLRGGDSFVQIALGVSTYYDEKVTHALTTHEMAIRSAVLTLLAQQDPGELATPEGKERLRQALRNSVNQVLTSREGFGGIDEVYFTSFVTQ